MCRSMILPQAKLLEQEDSIFLQLVEQSNDMKYEIRFVKVKVKVKVKKDKKIPFYWLPVPVHRTCTEYYILRVVHEC